MITKEESETLSKEKISEIWRELLHGTEINPIDIITNIEFPISDSENNKEGIIFLRKLDINGERLYLIAFS